MREMHKMIVFTLLLTTDKNSYYLLAGVLGVRFAYAADRHSEEDNSSSALTSLPA